MVFVTIETVSMDVLWWRVPLYISISNCGINERQKMGSKNFFCTYFLKSTMSRSEIQFIQYLYNEQDHLPVVQSYAIRNKKKIIVQRYDE